MNTLNSSGSGGFSDFRPAILFLIFATGLTLGIVLCGYALNSGSKNSDTPQPVAQSIEGESTP